MHALFRGTLLETTTSLIHANANQRFLIIEIGRDSVIKKCKLNCQIDIYFIVQMIHRRKQRLVDDGFKFRNCHLSMQLIQHLANDA